MKGHQPVIWDVEVEVAHVRGVFGQDDVAGELTRGEPEGKVGNVIELEFGVNPAERTMSTVPCDFVNTNNQSRHGSLTLLFVMDHCSTPPPQAGEGL